MTARQRSSSVPVMPSTPPEGEGFRPKISEGLNLLRHKFRRSRQIVNSISAQSSRSTLIVPKPDTSSKHASPSTSSTSLSRTQDTSLAAASTEAVKANVTTPKADALEAANTSSAEEENTALNISAVGPALDIASSDLWSAAYQEAVDNLGQDIDHLVLKGENLTDLLKQLEETDVESNQDSAFLRGVKYLQSIQVPLEKFKLALDIAAPLTSTNSTPATVFGALRGVTAMAISLSTANMEFATTVGEMLEQISYIDDCDTLGRKAERVDIHKALVPVYQKLLEFYNVAFGMLAGRGARLLLKITLENQRLPEIVQDFLKQADLLHRIVQKATWEIVEDIRAMLYDDKISKWLGSDKLTRQSQFHADLQLIRADKACEFLLSDPKFISWYDASSSQQLVILGDMGHGKTVSMAFLVDELRRRNEHQLPRSKMCYHYCRNDETGKTTHILSAMILSLLEQLTGFKKTFFEWYKQAVAAGNFEPATNAGKLEEFLEKMIESLDRPLFVVIDGLDECDDTSRSMLLKSLQNLSQKTTKLKTMLSSRPQEEILEQLGGMPSIILGPDSERDKIIAKQIIERELPYLLKDLQELLTEKLSNLAQGSAIWTRMVVELIALRRIRALGPMQTFLKDIPQPKQLLELYTSLFLRKTSEDWENMELAIAALEVLAISRRPLSILELAWAVAISVAPDSLCKIAELVELVDYQRVMSLIQPFIARADFNDLKKRQVRLVHQSVKEFILGEWVSNRPVIKGPIGSDPELTRRRTASLEGRILNICIKYLLLDDIDNRSLFSEVQVAIDELPQEFDLFSDHGELPEYDPTDNWETREEGMNRYDPTERGFGELFVYASSHWMEHFGGATDQPLPSPRDLEKLCQVGTSRLENWVNQNCRPNCTIKARFVFDPTLYDALGLTALYGSDAIFREILDKSDFNSSSFLPETAMGAVDQIIQWGKLSRIRLIFMESPIGYQLWNIDFFQLIMTSFPFAQSQPREDWETVFDLVNDVSEILVKERWGNKLLDMAARIGCMPIIQRLMNRAQNDAELKAELLREPELKPETTPQAKESQGSIGEAVLSNNIEVVEYLLGQDGIETHLRHRNSEGENVIHLASRLSNPEMFNMLAPRFREGIYQTTLQGETPMIQVVKSSADFQNRKDSALILLQEGVANRHQHPKLNEKALQLARQLGDTGICDILVS